MVSSGGQSIVSIIEIDMHLRDGRVLDYIRSKAQAGCVRVSHEHIADQFLCSRKTALAIIKRLEQAGHIQCDRTTGKRGGYWYTVA